MPAPSSGASCEETFPSKLALGRAGAVRRLRGIFVTLRSCLRTRSRQRRSSAAVLPGRTRMVSSPPRSCTWTSSPPGQTPSSVRAATVAQVPVPQAHVSPLPRSPHPHLQVGGVHHLHELGVDALREVCVVLKGPGRWLPASGCPHPPPMVTQWGLPTLMQVTATGLPSTSRGQIHQRPFAHVHGGQAAAMAV